MTASQFFNILENHVLIGGEWKKTSKTFSLCNPFDEQVIAEIGLAGANEIEQALLMAEQGFKETRIIPRAQRSEILLKTADLLIQRKEALARLITLEVGKTIKEARSEVLRTAETFKLSALVCLDFCGEEVPFDAARTGKDKWGYYTRVPAGPVLSIVPFNFPMNLTAHKLAPAIAAGNSVIIKPASQTPLSSFILALFLLEAGLPPKAISVICGPGQTVGEPLVKDDRIKVVTFTGSVPVGKRITEIAGLKRITMELGSNSGVLIMPDANLDFAARRVQFGAFALAGQVCISVQRVYVHQSVFDPFLQRLEPLTKAMKLGNPLHEETDMGPLISRGEVNRIADWVNKAVSKGAVVRVGGKAEGNFYPPTILTEVPPDSELIREEAFAPVVIVERVNDFEEGLGRLNDSKFGLQAGVFTNNIQDIKKAFDRLEVGGILINEVPTFRVDLMPYGGVKDSGIGREGPKYALETMTTLKLLGINSEPSSSSDRPA